MRPCKAFQGLMGLYKVLKGLVRPCLVALWQGPNLQDLVRPYKALSVLTGGLTKPYKAPAPPGAQVAAFGEQRSATRRVARRPGLELGIDLCKHL